MARRDVAALVTVLLASTSTLPTSEATSTTTSTTMATARTGTPTTANSTSTAGAVYSQHSSRGYATVWGHDHAARGVERVRDETLSARLDLLRALRDHTPLEKCRAALDEVLEARRQLALWALRMHTSSVTLPDALVSGAIFHLGDFDACLSAPASAYCLLDVEVRPAADSPTASSARLHVGDERSPFDPQHGDNATLWDLLRTSGNRRRYRRDLQHWALCVPSACAGRGRQHPRPGRPAADVYGDLHDDVLRQLGLAVADALDGVARSLGVELRVHFGVEACAASEGGHQDDDDVDGGNQRGPRHGALRQLLKQPLFVAGSLFILAFPTLAVIATLRRTIRKHGDEPQDRDEGRPGDAGDPLRNQRQGLLSRMLDCFAVQAHWRHLHQRKKSEIHVIQGIRVVSMIAVVVGHRADCILVGPVQNPEYIEDALTDVSGMYVASVTLVVSSFFVVSAFLDIRTCLRAMQSEGTCCLKVGFILRHYWNRFLRLVPALAVTLAVEALWLEHMGSGPFWHAQAGRFADHCKEAWWTNLLFIQNYYINLGRACLVQTWFLAADMQLHLATPLVAWLLVSVTSGRRSTWPAFAVLGALLCAAGVVRYANTVLRGLHPTLLFVPELLRDWKLLVDPTATMQYVAAHTNAIPYVVGLIAGALLFFSEQRGWQLPKRARTALWLGIPVGHALQTAVILSGALLYRPDLGWPRTLSVALLGPARLLLFAAPTALVIYACAAGCGGAFNSVLSWTPLLPLDRLSYCVFLVHMTVIKVQAGLVRHPYKISVLNVARSASSDLMTSVVFALALHLAVEGPMASLRAMLVKHTTNSSRNVKESDQKLSNIANFEQTAPWTSPARGRFVGTQQDL